MSKFNEAVAVSDDERTPDKQTKTLVALPRAGRWFDNGVEHHVIDFGKNDPDRLDRFLIYDTQNGRETRVSWDVFRYFVGGIDAVNWE